MAAAGLAATPQRVKIMDENCKEIGILWAEGLTGAEIAKRLGITRGSVLGKVHRMREAGLLTVRMSDQRIRAIKAEIRRKEAERLASLPQPTETAMYRVEDKEIQLASVNVEPVVDVGDPIVCEEVQPEPMRMIPFEKLAPKSCRFVVNSGNPADFLFCGRVKTGRSYCDEHMKICYVPNIKKAAKT